MRAITAEVVDTGEKRDRRGRRSVPEEVRREMLARYRGSGLTMAEFVRREKVNYATFAGWVARGQKGGAQESKPAFRFAEVRFPSAGSGTMEVRLIDGTIVRGERVADLATLVRALRS